MEFFGFSDDVHFLTQAILLKRPKAKLFNIGISSGSGLIANHFGQNNNDFLAGIKLIIL
jgi:predicted alpha/beta-fold hydrolase